MKVSFSWSDDDCKGKSNARTWQKDCLEAPRQPEPNNKWPNKALARQSWKVFFPKAGSLDRKQWALALRRKPSQKLSVFAHATFSNMAKIKLIEQRPWPGEKCLDMLCPPMFHSPWLQVIVQLGPPFLNMNLCPGINSRIATICHIFEWLSAHL